MPRILVNISKGVPQTILFLELIGNKYGDKAPLILGKILKNGALYANHAGVIFRPIAFGLSAFIQAYNLCKAIYKMWSNQDPYYTVDSILNGLVAAVLLTFTLVSLINPASIIAMSIASTFVGALSKIKALSKSFAKNEALKQKCLSLSEQLKSTDSENEKINLNCMILDLESIIKMRQYKIANRLTVALTSLICIAEISVALALGPVGWTLAGITAFLGFCAKEGIYIHKRYNLDKQTIDRAKWSKLKDVRIHQETYVNYIKQLGKEVVHGSKSESEPIQAVNTDSVSKTLSMQGLFTVKSQNILSRSLEVGFDPMLAQNAHSPEVENTIV